MSFLFKKSNVLSDNRLYVVLSHSLQCVYDADTVVATAAAVNLTKTLVSSFNILILSIFLRFYLYMHKFIYRMNGVD